MSPDFSYADVVYGHDEPDAIWGRGDVMIEMCKKLGDDHPLDIDGNEIDPTKGYVMTKKGIYKT